MLERLANLLSGLATPAQVQSVLEAAVVLTDNGFHQCNQLIENEVALCADEPAKLVGNLIDVHLIPMMREFLQTMGIILVPDISLTDATAVLEGVLRIDNFDDPDTIFNIATSDEDSVECFLGIMATVTIKDENHWAPLIESVSDNLISRIAELIGDFSAPVAVDYGLYMRAKGRVLRYVEYLKQYYPNIYRDHINLSDLKLGCPVEALLVNMRDHLEDFEPNAAVAVIVLYVLSSDEDDASVAKSVSVEVGETFTDMVKGMAAARQAARFLTGANYVAV